MPGNLLEAFWQSGLSIEVEQTSAQDKAQGILDKLIKHSFKQYSLYLNIFPVAQQIKG